MSTRPCESCSMVRFIIMTLRNHSFRTAIWILTAILSIQTAMLLYVSAQKQEYHIDEIYSYVISNSYDTDRISNGENIHGTWTAGEAYNDFVTVQPGEGFAYRTVYRNTSTDCHPPLYYWLLHTLCSLFPNQFSKWFGLSLNIALYVLTALVIYRLSDELFAADRLKFLPLVMYGLSPFAVDTVLFIRMYMLQTLLAVLFTLLNVRMLKYGITWKRLLAVWASTFLGAMTQYYSVVFCFWGVLIHVLLLLKNKDFKHILLYGFGALVSVGLMLAVFPYAITQATGSSTNDIGNEVMRTLLDFRLWGEMTISLSKSLIERISYYGPASYAVAVAAVALFVYLAIQNPSKETTPLRTEVLWMLWSTVLTFFSISYIGGSMVHLRYIYFLLPLIYILILLALDTLTAASNRLRRDLICLFLVFSIGNALVGTALNRSLFLFRQTYADDVTLSAYHGQPCFVVTGKTDATAIPTGNFTKISAFDSVYMDTAENVIASREVSKTLVENGSCVVFVCTNTYWVEGIEAEDFFGVALPEGCTYSFICDGCLGQYYLVSAQP